VPELERPPRKPAPSQETADGSQGVAEDTPGPAPAPGATGRLGASSRLPCWRRVFGG